MEATYISSFFETFGLGIFFFYLINGLKNKLLALNETVTIQNKTLEVMERRVEETEKIGNIYRNLMSNLPQDLDNFKTILSKTKDETILELKNNQEITQKKLEEAQEHIEKSKQNPEMIKMHLKILKNILSKREDDDEHFKKDYDISALCEYGDRTLEQCVPLIVSSKTLDIFLAQINFDVEVTEDTTAMGIVFSNSKSKNTPKGFPLQHAYASQSISGGWHVMANNELYLNSIRLDELKDEFSAIKTIV